jgi:hypothetical protein
MEFISVRVANQKLMRRSYSRSRFVDIAKSDDAEAVLCHVLNGLRETIGNDFFPADYHRRYDQVICNSVPADAYQQPDANQVGIKKGLKIH